MRRFLLALLVGASAGIVMGFGINTYVNQLTSSPVEEPAAEPVSEQGTDTLVENRVALEYARAYQEGNWDLVVEKTLWMQERLERVQLETGKPEARGQAKAQLVAQLEKWDLAQNQLRLEGVEDRYIFAPGVRLEVLRQDEGQTGLERPVKHRTWIRVTYPSRSRALTDQMGLPIHGLTVGVNVSEEGMILKAGVVGNLDIDEASISYIWEPAPGE